MKAPMANVIAHAAGLAAGYALDAALGDPRRLHPVAGYGRLAGALEKRLYAADRRAGVRFAAVAVGAPVVAAAAIQVALRRRPLAGAAVTAATTWAVLGGASLRREATALADSLDAGEVDAARQRLTHLCGRDPSTLDGGELSRATVESVAENTSDAVVAPLVWGALAGLPGLVGYRAVNTLDAMVGHRDQRYARFGTASARVDDLANLLPSRLTALLMVALAPRVGGSRGRAIAVWLADGNQHPSPNAGQCEAAMAGALGVRLGGVKVYSGHPERRPTLGAGQPPAPDDIRRAAQLSAAVGTGAAALAVGYVVLRPIIRRLRSGVRSRSGVRRR
jgi:adenosylcobinamide-phosphate synthase